MATAGSLLAARSGLMTVPWAWRCRYAREFGDGLLRKDSGFKDDLLRASIYFGCPRHVRATWLEIQYCQDGCVEIGFMVPDERLKLIIDHLARNGILEEIAQMPLVSKPGEVRESDKIFDRVRPPPAFDPHASEPSRRGSL